MSKIPQGRRRADAERSAAAVLDAAVRVLGRRPAAGLEEVAAAAGVSRQTVYAHFGSRDGLLRAVLERITAEAVTEIDAADPDSGAATDALLRLFDRTWRLFERYPLLLDDAAIRLDPVLQEELHRPVLERFERVLRRGREAGELDREASLEWTLAALVALGHTAGEQVARGVLTPDEAAAALGRSVLRLVARMD